MVQVLNSFSLKYLLKSAINPITPVFMGSWNERSSSKWRGTFAELSYNSYLRNGWVVIDSGVKGSSGTPIIEFSSWEYDSSDYNITLPNVLSYKYFFKKSAWRFGFLARTSIIAQEEWGAKSLNYFNILNNSARVRFLARSYSFIAQLKPVSILFSSFAGITPLLNKTSWPLRDNLFVSFRGKLRLYGQVLRMKSRLLSFSTFDCFNGVHSQEGLRLAAAGVFFLENLVRTRLTKSVGLYKATILVGQNSVNSTISRANLSFKDLCFKFSSLVVFLMESRTLLNYNYQVAQNIMASIILDITSLILLTYKPAGQFDAKFLVWLNNFSVVVASLISKFIMNSKLTPNAFILIWYNFLINKVLNKIRNSVISLPATLVQLAKARSLPDMLSYKFKKLFNSSYVNKVSANVESCLDGSRYSLNNFLNEYIRVRRKWRFLPKRNFFNFKRKNFFKKFRKSLKRPLNLLEKRYPKGRWFKKHRFSRFKLFINRRQFLFLFFWSFNFFNFFSVQRPTRNFLLLATRLIYFFKAFSAFLRFYKFVFNYWTSFVDKNCFYQKNPLLVNSNYFTWLLYHRFRKFLAAFYSFSKKLFNNFWHKIYIKRAGIFAVFSSTMTSITNLLGVSGNTFKSALSLPLTPLKKAFIRGTHFLPFLSLYSNYLESVSVTANTGFIKLTNYLRFLLSIRKSVLVFFKRKLQGILRLNNSSRNKLPLIDTKYVNLAGVSRNKHLISDLLSKLLQAQSFKKITFLRRSLLFLKAKLAVNFKGASPSIINLSSFNSIFNIRATLVRVVRGLKIRKYLNLRKFVNFVSGFLTSLTGYKAISSYKTFRRLILVVVAALSKLLKIIKKQSKFISVFYKKRFGNNRISLLGTLNRATSRRQLRFLKNLKKKRLNAPLLAASIKRVFYGVSSDFKSKFNRLASINYDTKFNTLLVVKRALALSKQRRRFRLIKEIKYNGSSVFNGVGAIQAASEVNSFFWADLSSLLMHNKYNLDGGLLTFLSGQDKSSGSLLFRYISRTNSLNKFFSIGSRPLVKRLLPSIYPTFLGAYSNISKLKLGWLFLINDNIRAVANTLRQGLSLAAIAQTFRFKLIKLLNFNDNNFRNSLFCNISGGFDPLSDEIAVDPKLAFICSGDFDLVAPSVKYTFASNSNVSAGYSVVNKTFDTYMLFNNIRAVVSKYFLSTAVQSNEEACLNFLSGLMNTLGGYTAAFTGPIMYLQASFRKKLIINSYINRKLIELNALNLVAFFAGAKLYAHTFSRRIVKLVTLSENFGKLVGGICLTNTLFLSNRVANIARTLYALNTTRNLAFIKSSGSSEQSVKLIQSSLNYNIKISKNAVYANVVKKVILPIGRNNTDCGLLLPNFFIPIALKRSTRLVFSRIKRVYSRKFRALARYKSKFSSRRYQFRGSNKLGFSRKSINILKGTAKGVSYRGKSRNIFKGTAKGVSYRGKSRNIFKGTAKGVFKGKYARSTFTRKKWRSWKPLHRRFSLRKLFNLPTNRRKIVTPIRYYFSKRTQYLRKKFVYFRSRAWLRLSRRIKKRFYRIRAKGFLPKVPLLVKRNLLRYNRFRKLKTTFNRGIKLNKFLINCGRTLRVINAYRTSIAKGRRIFSKASTKRFLKSMPRRKRVRKFFLSFAATRNFIHLKLFEVVKLFSNSLTFGAPCVNPFDLFSFCYSRKLARAFTRLIHVHPLTKPVVNFDYLKNSQLLNCYPKRSSLVNYYRTFLRSALVSRFGTLSSASTLGYKAMRGRLTFFKTVRAIRSLYLLPKVWKRGLLPRPDRKAKRLYWKLVKDGKIVPKDDAKLRTKMAFLSIFDRRNERSMKLENEFKKTKFRFKKVPAFFDFRKKMKASIRLVLFKMFKLVRNKKRLRSRLFKKIYRLVRKRRKLKSRKLRFKFRRRLFKLILRGVVYLRLVASTNLKQVVPSKVFSKFLKLGAKPNMEVFSHAPLSIFRLLVIKYLVTFYKNTIMIKARLRLKFVHDAKLVFILKFIYFFFKKTSSLFYNLRLLGCITADNISDITAWATISNYLTLKNSTSLSTNSLPLFLYSQTRLSFNFEIFGQSLKFYKSSITFPFDSWGIILNVASRISTAWNLTNIAPLNLINMFEKGAADFLIWKRHVPARLNRSKSTWRFIILRNSADVRMARKKIKWFFKNEDSSVRIRREYAAKLYKRLFSSHNKVQLLNKSASPLLKLPRLRTLRGLGAVSYARILSRTKRVVKWFRSFNRYGIVLNKRSRRRNYRTFKRNKFRRAFKMYRAGRSVADYDMKQYWMRRDLDRVKRAAPNFIKSANMHLRQKWVSSANYSGSYLKYYGK